MKYDNTFGLNQSGFKMKFNTSFYVIPETHHKLLKDVKDLTQLFTPSNSIIFIQNPQKDSYFLPRSQIPARSSQNEYTHDLPIHQNLKTGICSINQSINSTPSIPIYPEIPDFAVLHTSSSRLESLTNGNTLSRPFQSSMPRKRGQCGMG